MTVSLSRRRFATGLAGTTALGMAPGARVLAQSAPFPDKPIRFVVPFSPGGAADVLARAVGQWVGTRLGQPVVVENRPGAGGSIAGELVAKSPPDGYTLFVGSTGPLAINATLYSKLPYNPVTDFAPVSLAVLVQNIVVVRPGFPAANVRELLELARRQPGKLTYASSGNGTSLHLAGELLKSMTGVDITHVPYKGGAPAITDLMGGQVDMMFAVAPDAMPHIRAGKITPLAVAGASRSPSLPDLPTVAEAAVPGFEASAWYGFVAPAKTPDGIVAVLNQAINQALATPEVRDRLSPLGFEIVGSDPKQFAGRIDSEVRKWGAVIKSIGIKAD